MGLDTRAFRVATPEWRQEWVRKTNEKGERPVFFGLMVETLSEPLTLDDAPQYHQDGLDDLNWPGGLIGGIFSSDGGGPSFRGKVYAGYVEAVTGRSLYEAADDYWKGADLTKIAEDLALAVDSPPAEIDTGDLPDRVERDSLARWFAVCVEHGLVVGGDY